MSTAERRHWRFRDALTPFRTRLGLGAALMALRSLVLVVAPWPLKYVVDTVLLGHRPPHWLTLLVHDPLSHRMLVLDGLAGAILLAGIADSTLDYYGTRIFLEVGQRVVFAVRRALFAHLIGLPPEFHRRRRGGEMMTRLAEDTARLQEAIGMVGSVLPHTITIVGMMTVMLAVNARYALAIAGAAPLLIWISHRWSGLLRRNVRLARTRDGELWSGAQEMLGAVALIQASGRQDHELSRFTGRAETSLAAGLQASLTQAQFPPLVNLVITAGTGLLTWYGARLVLQGRISTGDLLVFLAYLRGLVTPARQVAKSSAVFSRCAIALERLREIFAERPSVADPPGAVAPARTAGVLEFHAVAFAYRPGESTLSDIGFRLEPGMTIALVGQSGAGKSTIAALATRFMDPARGHITLDGTDLRALPLAHVRRQIAWLAQEPLLLHGTVWENIAYACPGADRRAAERAVEQSGIAEIIAALPGGLDHPVSERGATLSGGQRQAIAIARATLAQSPVILLDEPTSALDARTEQIVLAALRRLTARRATLVIAHRLDTIRSAHRILVLHHGRIVQSGTHAELMGAAGPYAALYRAQSGKPAEPMAMLPC